MVSVIKKEDKPDTKRCIVESVEKRIKSIVGQRGVFLPHIDEKSWNVLKVLIKIRQTTLDEMMIPTEEEVMKMSRLNDNTSQPHKSAIYQGSGDVESIHEILQDFNMAEEETRKEFIDTYDDGDTWTDGALNRPAFKDINVCYVLHALCCHFHYSLSDVLRMKGFTLAVHVEYEHTYI